MASLPPSMPALAISGLTKRYGDVVVLDIPSFTLSAGEQRVLIGASGSGKSTLLNVIAGITPPTSGMVQVAGHDITRLSEEARDRFRAEHVGYIFQSFNLLPAFTALENVELGGTFAGNRGNALRERARTLLDRVGLADRASHRPRQLSVGEQQRVAVARALLNRPSLVLADEPTANLDPTTGAAIVDLIREACAAEGSALLLVTHDREVMGRFEEKYEMKYKV